MPRSVTRRNQKRPPTDPAFPYLAPCDEGRCDFTKSCWACCRIRLPVAAGRGFIFDAHLACNVLGYKAAVISEAAFDQRLRFVHKLIRQRLAAYVTYRQQFPFAC